MFCNFIPCFFVKGMDSADVSSSIMLEKLCYKVEVHSVRLWQLERVFDAEPMADSANQNSTYKNYI